MNQKVRAQDETEEERLWRIGRLVPGFLGA
jgi:hypothetical protein